MINIDASLDLQSVQLASIEGGLQTTSAQILQTISGNETIRFILISREGTDGA